MEYFKNVGEEYNSSLSIEMAVLQKDIKLPEITKEPLTLKTLEAFDLLGSKYILPHEVYTDVIGNFYIPILFPLVENGESNEEKFKAPNTKNILNKDGFSTAPYVQRNYIKLLIPKYIVLGFTDVISAGTKFVVAFTGGATNLSAIKVIGLYEPTKSDGGEII